MVAIPSFYSNGGSDAGTRRSTRLQPSQTGKSSTNRGKVKRKTMRYEIEKHETFKSVRLSVSQKLKIPALYLRFFYNGREIDNADETMETIGISAGEAFYVLEFDAGDAEVDISKLQDVAPPTRTNSTRLKSGGGFRIEGFTGTGLLGQTTSLDDTCLQLGKRVSSDQQDDLTRQTQSAGEMGSECAICTFLNAPGMVVCEMCNESLLPAEVCQA